MKKIVTILILSFFTLGLASSVFAQSNSIYNQANAGLQEAVDQGFGGGNKIRLEGDPFVGGLVAVINALLTFIGVIFFLLLIYAGWIWMTARGNETEIEKAKKMLREVVIGLIIIIFARLFTEFVIYQLSQASATTPR